MSKDSRILNDIKTDLVGALENVYTDLELLKRGIWEPDAHSIEDSKIQLEKAMECLIELGYFPEGTVLKHTMDYLNINEE